MKSGDLPHLGVVPSADGDRGAPGKAHLFIVGQVQVGLRMQTCRWYADRS